MRILGTDFSMKYVIAEIAEIDKKEITISFRENFWKGIYDISFRVNGEERKVEIKSTYPGFIRKIQELALLIQLKLEQAVDCITKSNR